jgi:subtilisin family serine protease
MNIRTRLVCACAVTGGLLAALVSTAGAARGHVLRPDGTAIAGSYIVVLKDGVVADAVAARSGGRVTQRFSAALNGFAATMTEAQAQRVAANPAVAHVEEDQVVTMAADQTNPPSWGTDRVDQRALPLDNKYSYSTTASNVTAYIIDSGITNSHNDFGGRAVHGRNTVDSNNDSSDCNGHGTHVAGTVGGTKHGIAKGVKLVGVKVFGCAGGSSASAIIAGIDWVTANAVKPAVANLSLGGGRSPSIDAATQRLIDSGVTTVVAAGNENANACDRSPASLPDAITVGASNTVDARWSSSNWGACLDLFAPGQDITSAKWQTADGSFSTSGTSMAAPQVAGAAALHLAANPTANHHQVSAALIGATTPGVLNGVGTGSPNKLLYVGGGSTTPAPACSATAPQALPIPDAGSAVTSSLTVSGCPGTTTTATVAVDITHTFRGDLVIDLIAPDGSSYRLKNSSASDSAANLAQTYTATVSETRNGSWRLSVRDVYRSDTGRLNTWTLTV